MAENSMLNNNLLLYFLAGAGRGIGGQGSVGDVLGQGVQQQIGAESQSKVNAQYMKMLQGMLAGGGKINMDKDNINIKAPIGAFNNNSGGQTPSMSSGTSALATPTNPSAGGGDWMKDFNMGGALNPSVSPPDVMSANLAGLENVPQAQTQPSDIQPIPREMLAGLTPENVSQALSGAVSVNNLRESKISEVANRMLQERILDYEIRKDVIDTAIKLNTEKEKNSLDMQFPIPVTGLGHVTLREWEALPLDTKSYEAYKFQSKIQNPDDPIMSQQEWKQSVSEDNKLAYLQGLKDHPELFKVAKDLASSGSTTVNIGEAVAKKAAIDEVDIKNYFRTKLPEDVDKFISSKETRRDLIQYTEPKEKTKQTMLAKDKFIRGKIVSTGGSIMDIVTEGRTRIYKVKWKDGSTDEVKYAF